MAETGAMGSAIRPANGAVDECLTESMQRGTPELTMQDAVRAAQAELRRTARNRETAMATGPLGMMPSVGRGMGMSRRSIDGAPSATVRADLSARSQRGSTSRFAGSPPLDTEGDPPSQPERLCATCNQRAQRWQSSAERYQMRPSNPPAILVTPPMQSFR